MHVLSESGSSLNRIRTCDLASIYVGQGGQTIHDNGFFFGFVFPCLSGVFGVAFAFAAAITVLALRQHAVVPRIRYLRSGMVRQGTVLSSFAVDAIRDILDSARGEWIRRHTVGRYWKRIDH